MICTAFWQLPVFAQTKMVVDLMEGRATASPLPAREVRLWTI